MGRIVVGFSGGVDSSVLLHALAALPGMRARGLAAIHVDHGLHAGSTAWSDHCARFAASLDVPLHVASAQVDRDSGLGLEAAARAARYSAFSTCINPEEIVALAHHRDDQTETVLLKLLRGAGPEGLAGMRTLRKFDLGRLWRPLLEVPRSALLAYAKEHGIDSIEDPANADLRHARNYLRREVLPMLRTRWPQLDSAIGHSARWLGASADYLNGAARSALAELQGLDPATLRWKDWLELPDALRATSLRLWLRTLRLGEPEQVHVAELERQLRDAHAQRLPCVHFGNTELRRHRDLLYAMTALTLPPANWCTRWDGSAELELPATCGSLILQGDDPHRAVHDFTVRFRRGGEIFRPAGDLHRRELRDLLQIAGIPPWQRGRIPLVYSGSTLLAVADVWSTEEGACYFSAQQRRLIWRDGSLEPALSARNPIDPAATLR